ncbi:MAG TPA: hypothetical protein VMD74_03770 [Candidatus Methylomirabilis sp.]|nr:hypothetical protein [Candidatus Methylomirabilis sp.]
MTLTLSVLILFFAISTVLFLVLFMNVLRQIRRIKKGFYFPATKILILFYYHDQFAELSGLGTFVKYDGDANSKNMENRTFAITPKVAVSIIESVVAPPEKISVLGRNANKETQAVVICEKNILTV